MAASAALRRSSAAAFGAGIGAWPGGGATRRVTALVPFLTCESR
jgi:hypothetical protein